MDAVPNARAESVAEVIARRRPRAPFSWAIAALRDGHRVTRLAWADPDRWLRVDMGGDGDRSRTPTWPSRSSIVQLRDGHLEPWTATHADLLATDWTLAGDNSFVRDGDLWRSHYGVFCVVGTPLATERASVGAGLLYPHRHGVPRFYENSELRLSTFHNAYLIAENVPFPRTEAEALALRDIRCPWDGGPIPGDALLRGEAP